MNRLSLSVIYLFVLLVPTNSFSQSLPIEIDYVSAKKVYEKNLVNSDTARALADDSLKNLNQTKFDITHHENVIVRGRSQIDSNEREIYSLNDSTQNLISTNTYLESNNRQIIGQIDSLRITLRNLDARISEQRGKLTRPLNDRNVIISDLNNLEREIRSLSQSRSEKENELQRVRRELNQAQRNLESLESEAKSIRRDLPEFRNRIVGYEREISEARGALERAKSEKSSLESKVSSLKRELDSLESKLRQSEQRLAQLKNEISPLTNKLRELKSKKQNLESEISQSESSLQNEKSKLSSLESQRQSLPREISNLRGRISSLESEISRAKQSESQAYSELSRANSEYEAVSAEITRLRAGPIDDAIKARLASLREEQKTLSNRRMALQASAKQYADDASRLGSQISKIQNEIASHERTLSNIDSSISQSQNEIRNLEGRIRNLISQRGLVDSEINSLNSELSRYESRISSLEQEVRSDGVDVSRKSDELRAARQELARVNNEISSSTNKISTSQTAIENTRSRISQLQDRLERIKSEVGRAESDINQFERKQNLLETEVSQIASRLASYEREKNRFERDLYEINNVIANLERQLNDYLQESNKISNEVASLTTSLSSNQNTIAQNKVMINANESQVSYLEQEIVNLRKSIAVSKKSLEELQPILVRNQNVFDVNNSKAIGLETATAESLGLYESKLALYKSYEIKAQNLGKEQALALAREQGENLGHTYVLKEAALIGSDIGKELAFLDGELRGLVEGLSKGEEIGYQDGVNSQDDFELGRIDGYKLGELNATNLAKKEELPRGYGDYVSKLISSVEVVSKANQVNKKASLNLNIQERILKLRQLIERFSDPSVSKSEPRFSYIAPRAIDVDISKRECSDVYKNTQTLVTACQISYELSFKETFKNSHRDIYFNEFEEIYSASREESFDLNKNEKFNEAYKLAYDEAYLLSKFEGAKVAFQAGFEEGEVSGFRENIDLKRAFFFKEGFDKASEFYTSNSLVRFNTRQGTKIRALAQKGLIQGSPFELGLGLLNFSKIDSQDSSIVIEIQRASNNITLSTNRVSVKSVKGLSKLNIVDLFKGTIREDALPGSEILVVAKISYPKNGIGQEQSEQITFLDKVKVNPEVQVKTSFSSKVEWRDWKIWPLKWVYRSHDIKVRLTGLRNNIPGSYDVELEVLKGAGYIKVSSPKVKAVSPGRDEVSEASIKYTFKKDAKDKDLSFRVKISYAGEIISQELINIKVD